MGWKFELLTKPYGGVTGGPMWDAAHQLLLWRA
jgi:hypothetical protein